MTKKEKYIQYTFSGSIVIATKIEYPKRAKNILKKMIDIGFQDVKVRIGE